MGTSHTDLLCGTLDMITLEPHANINCPQENLKRIALKLDRTPNDDAY